MLVRSSCTPTLRLHCSSGRRSWMANTQNYFAALGQVLEDTTVPTALSSKSSKQAARKKKIVSTVADVATLEPPRPMRLMDPLVWIDLEMTGLQIEKDTIIEIAVLLTDGQLNHVIEGPEIAISHGEGVLENMNDWCKEHHGASGLTQRVRDSKISMGEAEEQVLAFLTKHIEQGTAQLAGNSVHVDRLFLLKYMPKVTEFLHYRIVDVSTVRELCRRWYPNVLNKLPRKVNAHTALSDIKESIAELKFYKANVFRTK